jgi:hypothetical protein
MRLYGIIRFTRFVICVPCFCTNSGRGIRLKRLFFRLVVAVAFDLHTRGQFRTEQKVI